MDLNAIRKCKIVPGVGIARLGNSDSDFFIGPESPGDPCEPRGGFRDLYGRIKRQGARFRLFAFDSTEKALGEITQRDPQVRIEWTVQLANTKAEWFPFAGVRSGLTADAGSTTVQRRNAAESDRGKLKITPKAVTIDGQSKSGIQYQMVGSFYNQSVYLGEVRTDDDGRLIVLGGLGNSGSIVPNSHVRDYANNDGWYDDIADGTVNADVWVGDRKVDTIGSWVIVAPPKYGAFATPLITLYDVMRAAVKLDSVPVRPSFTKDVFPLFSRIVAYQWLNAGALRGHGPFQGGNFLDSEIFAQLRSNNGAAKPFRKRIFERIRDPRARIAAQASIMFMPPLSGDEGDAVQGDVDTWLCLLESQYDILKKWEEGDFDEDWIGLPPPSPPLEVMSPEEQVQALNRAALEPCVGGAFFPGIEITYIARDEKNYVEPFRLKLAAPGDATKRMALPWQGDFYDCQSNWWPTARPDDVVNEDTFDALIDEFQVQQRLPHTFAGAMLGRIPWARGVGASLRFFDPVSGIEPEDSPPAGMNGMLDQWTELGFVVPRQTPNAETVYVEVGRSRYDGLSDREYFYYMLNLDSFPDFIPKAKRLANEFLEAAERRMTDTTPGAVDDVYRPFPYTVQAFDNRLAQIYSILMREAAKPFDPQMTDYKDRQDAIERVRQFAPFNQTDGAWIRNISQAGPTDEINALLFSIWADEAGEGTTEKNHANLYTQLLLSLGITLPPLNSREYAFNAALLDSAFTVPVFQLVISQFTRTFFPEILGMTLRLEWEVPSLWPVIKIMTHYKIDAHFYRLHVGIDNAASGHGAKAKRAVELYLDQVRAQTGSEEEVQRQWKRIWNGYVAFRITGHLDEDVRKMLRDRRQHPLTPEDRVRELIVAKRPYGRLNHMDKALGGVLINDWFDDPDGFIEQLKAMVTPGHPESSLLMRKISFDGPMYKVFTDDEIQIWHNWIVSLAAAPAPQRPVEVEVSMLIDRLRPVASTVAAHQQFQLVGPDPDHPDTEIKRSVSWWFGQPTAIWLMRALKNEKNGLVVSHDPDASRFFTDFVVGTPEMADALSKTRIDGKTGDQILRDWIIQDCPIPQTSVDSTRRARAAALPQMQQSTSAPWLSSFSTDLERTLHVRQTVQGMAVVH